MALTATTTCDLIGGTQQIIFTNSATFDQINYSSSGITFASSSGVSLSKSDCVLYSKYLNTFYILLLVNFPSLTAQINAQWPLSVFEISETSSGVTHINYTQTSLGSSVYSINYVPVASAASYAARSSITITFQEFAMTVLMLNQYAIQVNNN